MKRFAAATAGLLSILLCFAPSGLAGSVVTVSVGTYPKFVAVNQATNLVYVSNFVSSNVSVIDGATNTVVATVPVGMSPEMLDVNSITNMVYVASYSGNSVSVIDGSTNTVVATIAGLSGPFGVAVNPVTNQIFVSNTGTPSVAVIDGASNTITATVSFAVGGLPTGLRVNSSTNLVYVADASLAPNVSVIDGSSDTVVNTFALPVTAAPVDIALDPITNHLFVTDSGQYRVVYVLDASVGTLLTTITGGKVPFKNPVYVVMFQPGKTILVSDYSSLKSVIEVTESTYTATGGLKGGSGPEGIAINRKTGKIYVAEPDSDAVNVYTSTSVNP